MRFEIVEINGIAVAEIFADGVILASLDDGLDMLGECMGAGVSRLVIKEENISPNFFDLGTKLAGDVLQKFTQYMVKLAIVMDFGHVEKPSLRDFIRESNRFGQIAFTSTVDEAMARLARP